MEDGPLLSDVIELAISAERTAESFYEKLSLMFREYAGISEFWRGMMRDEQEHARMLEAIRDSLSPEELAAPESPEIYNRVKSFLSYSTYGLLSGIQTLDDAYRAAVNLEFSEVNKLAALLMSRHIEEAARRATVLEALQAHGNKVQNIPSLFGDTRERCFIRVSPLD
jgi:rubrerythrin